VVRRLGLVVIAAAACSGSPDPGASGGSPASRAADVVVYGRIWTGDSAQPWVEAVALGGNLIAAAGSRADIARHVGPDTRVLDNGEAMVTPGFIDSHVHFLGGGEQLASVDLRDAATPAEFTRRLAAFARTLQPGEWITGGDWDHEMWGGTLPERTWFDSVTPDNPVFVQRLDGHMAVANSAALRAAGVNRDTRDVEGGTIVRGADGEPTGLLKDEAMGLVYQVVPSLPPARADSALARAMAWAASKGVTSVSAVSVGENELGAFDRAHAHGALTTRIAAYPGLSGWRAVAERMRERGAGDEWLRVAGVKAFVDGSLGSTTAWFFEPYDDEPTHTGLVTTPLDSLQSWMRAADSAGIQLAVHAIGDRANAWLLDAFAGVAQANGVRDRRPRIEHAQHLRRADIARFAELGVIPSMQPYHAVDDGRWAQKRIGPERIKTTYAFRSLLDAGARLAFGSDWTVAPMDPLLGIHAAVTRRTLDGVNPRGWVPEERITVEEALRAYTTAGAYAVFAERRRGMIRPGYDADLVLLDRDITRTAPEELDQARVRATIVAGRVVFAADSTSP
jgi:hypothetical protein